jgi:superfamily II DNA or RNA helicase
MVASLQELSPAFSYNSSEMDLVASFYVPCLEVSGAYDRAVGYFRSSIYQLIGIALSSFALNGGHMRLICSPGLTREDREVIDTVEVPEDIIARAIQRELDQLLRYPDNLSCLELLATLISCGALEIKIAYRPNEYGIFHEKIGIFHSPVDQLSFTGSANETFMAWDPKGNHEGFETFGSWDDTDRRRVERHIGYFESLWRDEVAGLRTVTLPELPQEILKKYINRGGIEPAIENARNYLRRIGRTKSAPRRELQCHQKAVVQNWAKNQRGIIDHVTGSGKTVSALEILRRWLSRGRSRCALVLVPSDLLTQQWIREINRELFDIQPSCLIVGGSLSSHDWHRRVTALTTPSPLGPRLVISTMKSASSSSFISRVTSGDHLLLIADEVHRLGSVGNREILSINAGGRLGLSATPERQGDLEGTQAIFNYFGPILEPHFGIQDAQQAGRLVPYDYHIDTVPLHQDEEEEYAQLSKRIIETRAAIGNTPSIDDQKRIDMLRIKRARIIKKARQKIPFASDVLTDEFKEGQRWLVYCEDIEQLHSIKELLATTEFDVQEYHSQMVGDPPATLRAFEKYGGVLLSIRCLDEGVDIPLVDHALILASSTNSREYIQRRGRVLRTAPEKYSAEVYDVLVYRELDGQRHVLNNDYERARQFAVFARNEACKFQLDALRDSSEDEDVQFEEEVEDSPW